jgi:hypothetical protein
VSKTYNQIVLQKALYNNILIDFLKIKVNCESVNHFGLLVVEIPIHDALELSVRDPLDFSVFNKLGKCRKKDFFRPLIAFFIVSFSIREGDE